MKMRFVIFFVLMFIANVASAQAEPIERIVFRSTDEAASLIDGYVLRPDGTPPFGAVVALHGCGGLVKPNGRLSSKLMDWALRLRAAGYVVLMPDSFGSRKLGSLCEIKDRPVTPQQRAYDALGAAEWLARQTYIDPKRMALLGWSNGGTTVLWTVEAKQRPRNTNFQTAIAFYPWCANFVTRTRRRPGVELTILIGRADDWTPAEPCEAFARRSDTPIMVYKGAYHGFDHPTMKLHVRAGAALSKRGDGIVHAGRDASARDAAIGYVMRLLQTRIGTPR